MKMKSARNLSAAALLLMTLGANAQQSYVPSKENLESRKEFSESRLGIFIHWGIYSMLGDGEWVQNRQDINYDEYSRLAAGFYPSRFDAKEWVRIFKDAGAGYITFTSRHHDGFSMFHTAQSEFNIVDGTPFGRDVVDELACACKDAGIRLHLYYSHLDWHRTDYWPRGIRPDSKSFGRPDGDADSWRRYEEFMNAQLTELLTNYGPIGCIWFDGCWDKTTGPNGEKFAERTADEWNIYEQYALIHKLQPTCLVGNNHHYTPFPGEDIQIFERDIPGCNEFGWSVGQEVATAFPLETCTTMNATWGFNINDNNFKSVDDIVRLLVRTAGKNANLLINVGPRPDGTIPDRSVEILAGLGEWMRTYGEESIKGTVGGFAPEEAWGVMTRKGNVIYVHVIGEGSTVTLPYRKVKSITTFGGTKLPYKKTKAGVSFEAAKGDGPDTIYKVML